MGARGKESLRLSVGGAASANIFSICSVSHLTIADGSNRNLSRTSSPLDFNHMNYSRRVAIWLLALSVQLIQACVYCGRLEMISVWLLFLKLLVGIQILKLVHLLHPFLHAQSTKKKCCRNSVCCICASVVAG